jgi:glycosyltransferase involved in cell wall biosynthesis
MRAPLQARCAALGLQARVRWVGRQPHAALPQWYAAAELLCLPSHAEGTPNVVLEAMACGLPVVATQVGGISEVLPHFAGLTVPLGDGNALQAALAAALAGEWDRERIVAHARRFDWSDNVRKLRALLEEAAA